MTNVFAVVGEHRLVRGRSLLEGDDGQYDAYAEGYRKMVPVRASADCVLDGERETGEATPLNAPRVSVSRHA